MAWLFSITFHDFLKPNTNVLDFFNQQLLLIYWGIILLPITFYQILLSTFPRMHYSSTFLHYIIFSAMSFAKSLSFMLNCVLKGS